MTADELLKNWAKVTEPPPSPKPTHTDLVCPRCKRRAFSLWMHAWLNGYKCRNCGYEESI